MSISYGRSFFVSLNYSFLWNVFFI
jgi:hypothetical protein